MDEREQYEFGYRVTQDGEFFDDQDCGPNGHFVEVSIERKVTPNGTVTTCNEIFSSGKKISERLIDDVVITQRVTPKKQ